MNEFLTVHIGRPTATWSRTAMMNAVAEGQIVGAPEATCAGATGEDRLHPSALARKSLCIIPVAGSNWGRAMHGRSR